MSKPSIEALTSRRSFRQEGLEGFALERQIQATAKMVDAAHKALLANKTE